MDQFVFFVDGNFGADLSDHADLDFFGDHLIITHFLCLSCQKVETVDYKNLKHTTAWGDMLFKMNGSNRFCGVFNSGSNSPIKISDNSYPGGSTRFLHDTTSNAENPSGYGSGVGTGPSNIPLSQMQNATAQVAAASGALIDWNNSNARHIL